MCHVCNEQNITGIMCHVRNEQNIPVSCVMYVMNRTYRYHVSCMTHDTGYVLFITYMTHAFQVPGTCIYLKMMFV
jgi:hypothetical protein